MLKYLTHKLKTQSINEENSNEKVSKFKENLRKTENVFHSTKRNCNFPTRKNSDENFHEKKKHKNRLFVLLHILFTVGS